MIEAKDMFGRALFVGAHVAVPQIYAQSATMLVGAIEKVRYTRSVDGRNVECPQVQADRFTLRVRPLVRTARYDRVLRSNFAPWLKQIPADCVIGIAGNHDFVFQEYPLSGYELPWNYLCDEEIEVDGVTFHGTPWVPGLPRWAFSADDEKLEKAYAAVPAYAHVLISHGPPYGCRDLTVPHFGSRRVGSKPLAQRLKDGRLAPQVLVCGHIHEGYGREKIGNTIVYNVAHVDEAYSDRVKPPLQIWEAE